MITIKVIGLICGITGLGLAITSLWLNLKRINDLEWRLIKNAENQFKINELISNKFEQLEKKGNKKCK